MELLIPGLILVALMVWASTRIKRDAAAAFEAETIETDEFIFHKPKGFLHVLNDDSGLALRAYSKDVPAGEHKGTRRSVIEVERYNSTPEDRMSAIGSAGGELTEVRSFIENERRAYAFKQQDGSVTRMYKLVSTPDALFEIRVIETANDDESILSDAESLISGFHLK